jgi:hypothetical protein
MLFYNRKEVYKRMKYFNELIAFIGKFLADLVERFREVFGFIDSTYNNFDAAAEQAGLKEEETEVEAE